MPKSTATVTKTGLGTAQLKEDLRRLSRSEVLVGIPADKAPRKAGVINNASLLYIHSKGSPLQHIPARPVLEPAIEANKDIITPHMAEGARAILAGDPDKAEKEFQMAGTVAANSAKRWFTDSRNGWAPNAPSTIRRKKSDKPLIDTGQLRRAITSVVREVT